MQENQALLSNYDRWLKQLVDNVGEDTRGKFQTPSGAARPLDAGAAPGSSLLKSGATYNTHPSAARSYSHSSGGRMT